MPEPHTTNLQTMANYHESCSPGISAIAETFNPTMAYNALDLSRWSWPLMSSQLRSPCRSFAHFGYSLTRGRIFSMAAHSADTLQASVGMVRLRLPDRFLPCGWGCIASDRTPHLIGWLFEGVQQDLHLQCFNVDCPGNAVTALVSSYRGGIPAIRFGRGANYALSSFCIRPLQVPCVSRCSAMHSLSSLLYPLDRRPFVTSALQRHTANTVRLFSGRRVRQIQSIVNGIYRASQLRGDLLLHLRGYDDLSYVLFYQHGLFICRVLR